MLRELPFRRPAAAAAIALTASLAIATASVAADAPTTPIRGQAARAPVSERPIISVGGAAAVRPTSTTQGFLGLATSVSTIPGLAGSPTDPDTPFINLVKSLRRARRRCCARAATRETWPGGRFPACRSACASCTR
jgi:hypothetical protein